MPLIGSANVKFDKATDMKGCLINILRPFNTSSTLILQKINELDGVKARGNYDIIKDINGAYSTNIVNQDDDEEAQDLLVSSMKRSYILKNVMNIVSHIPDRTKKAVCLIYLITEAQLLASNADDFKLVEEFDTDYPYILEDNKVMNKVIDEIRADVQNLGSRLEDIKARFKADVDPEVADEILSYQAETYSTMSTSDFFRAVKRKIGERYNQKVQDQISTFLKSYKKALKAATRGNVRDYCLKFNIAPINYTQDNIMRAMKPVFDLDIWT
ncbi:MAG: hypothetical protein MJZ34_03225 [Paludibacteraceae bacterium]|nr:hypothetical protein [Paludibacteraceae bacterium]